MITEGATAPDGAFHRVPRFHDKVIQEIFTHEVFFMLLRKKLIGLLLLQKILGWRHTGLNIHSKLRAQTSSEAERVGKGLGWVGVIRKVYEVDPLLCPTCEGRMSVVSFIEEPKTIDRINHHLELTFEAERPPPPHQLQQELQMAAEESREYF